MATRTTEGLREVLFDEIDKLRTGKCNPGHANALAKLASTIIETSRLEIDVAKLIAKAGEARQIQPLPLGGPSA
jgi:hypothetical protein